MTCDQQFLWIGTNPSLQCFHRRLWHILGQEFPLKCWEYTQTPDEPSSLETAAILLHEFVQANNQPLHLIGHGLGGALALIYARRYPKQVASVVLISVAAQPMITWQSYYYQQLAALYCQRSAVLCLVAGWISGIRCVSYVQHLADRLDRDLLEAPDNISLIQQTLPGSTGSIPQPLMVCGAVDDPVLMGSIFTDWLQYLKPGDRCWHQAQGGHFFHYQYADRVGAEVLNFWRQTMLSSLPCVLPMAIGELKCSD
jgi:pimeloyl-ACP methyl ester carboxylesterase